MNSRKMGRRKFMKGATSAFLGLATVPLWGPGSLAASTQRDAQIQYRTLGKTGLKVTAVAMGVMNCSDPAVVSRAFDLGVNFYDTARVYMGGKNEEMLGKALKGKRDRVLIQTKFRPTSSEKNNRASIETSLRLLQTDYVDVLLAHNLKTPEEVCKPDLVQFLRTMKKEGKARFTGFSSHTDMTGLLKAAAQGACHDVALVSYNFTHDQALKDAIAAAAKSGTGIVAMKTQAGGYKAGAMGGLTPHEAALKYVLTDSNVATAVPGVTTIEQMDECFGVMGKAFSKADSDSLQQYNAFLEGRICTMCGGCTGECPHGVAHTDVLRAVMYHDGYKDHRLAAEVLRTEGVQQSIKMCTHCSGCLVKCRRGLDIRGRMASLNRFLA